MVSRHVILLLMTSLILLEVSRSTSVWLMLSPSSISSINWDHNMLKRGVRSKAENKRYPRVRMVKRSLRIEDRVFLQTNKSPGDTFQRQSRKDVLNDFNDLAMMKNEILWNDNMVRRLKKERVWDKNLVRMIWISHYPHPIHIINNQKWKLTSPSPKSESKRTPRVSLKSYGPPPPHHPITFRGSGWEYIASWVNILPNGGYFDHS